jgi:lipopolysaccharide biosynthesis regulator YciM
MIKKLAVAATLAASMIVGVPSASAEPNCNECIYRADLDTWVCPTPEHYAICPF